MTTEKALYIGSAIAIKDHGRFKQLLRSLIGKNEVIVLNFHQIATSEEEAMEIFKDNYYLDDLFKSMRENYPILLNNITVNKLSVERISELFNREILA